MTDLCDLSDQLLVVTRDHPCYSQAIRIVQQCADHLRCVAHGIEANRRLLKRIKELENDNQDLDREVRSYMDAARD